MSAAILCSAKTYSVNSRSPCDKKRSQSSAECTCRLQQPPVSAVAAALAEQELRLLGIRLPNQPSLHQQRPPPAAAALSASAASSLLTSTPTAAAPTTTACFGRALADQPSREVPGFGRVPALLADCCAYLRCGGLLDTEGLFRVEGSRLRLRDLRQRLEHGCGIRDGTPPQDVCSTLKAWLRELPEPLVPARMAHALAEAAAQASPERRVRILRLCGLLLPADQLTALQFLCCFLGEVSRNSQRNRMDASNLATSLGPSLLLARAPSAAVCPREMARLNSGVALLVEFPSELGLHQHQHLLQLQQQAHHISRQRHQLDSGEDSSDSIQQEENRRRRRRSSGALGGALKAVGRAVSRLASRSRSRSPGRSRQLHPQPPTPQRPPRASPSPPAVRRLLHRLSAGGSSAASSGPTAVRRGGSAVAPAVDRLPPLAPPRKQPQLPPPPPPLPPLSTLPSASALRTPQLLQHHHQHHLHRAASADSPTHCSASSGPLRAVHSIQTTPLRVLQSPLA
ncbi:hypothetical protein BOX15_Mlig004668g3 [Macrostomum lignano]|uniref:Rho-GAP domain-containing protein n=1 Tax=Macrostomum lignano TaxID=282301 RepID=A0A267G6G8_9PLAT|nr:hypothetical protein BOX15_Mlig004668g3 [Macrostomum lignano]